MRLWDDVIIGEGNKLNSATVVFALPGKHGISQNSVSYWISDCYLGMSMTIFKYTEEGKHLTRMIENKEALDEIQDYLDNLILDKIDNTRLREFIARVVDNAFSDGIDQARKLMRQSLGI